LDVKLPVFNGFDVLKAVRSKNTDLRVIIYSQHDRPDFWDRARQLAANGYVSKTSHKNQLIDVIRRVVQGECLWENEIMYSSPPIM
jgi:DNA-binding NarL/FixJ family response regulator